MGLVAETTHGFVIRANAFLKLGGNVGCDKLASSAGPPIKEWVQGSWSIGIHTSLNRDEAMF